MLLKLTYDIHRSAIENLSYSDVECYVTTKAKDKY